MKALIAPFLRFLLIGASGTALHFGLLALGLRLGIEPVTASQAGALCGALWNYQLNRRLNYRSSRPHRQTGPRFALAALAGFLLNGLCVGVLFHGLGVGAWWSQCAATALVLAWNFLVNHFWTFREQG